MNVNQSNITSMRTDALGMRLRSWYDVQSIGPKQVAADCIQIDLLLPGVLGRAVTEDQRMDCLAALYTLREVKQRAGNLGGPARSDEFGEAIIIAILAGATRDQTPSTNTTRSPAVPQNPNGVQEELKSLNNTIHARLASVAWGMGEMLKGFFFAAVVGLVAAWLFFTAGFSAGQTAHEIDAARLAEQSFRDLAARLQYPSISELQDSFADQVQTTLKNTAKEGYWVQVTHALPVGGMAAVICVILLIGGAYGLHRYAEFCNEWTGQSD